MVHLPAGIYFQDVSSQTELKLPSASSSPIIYPHPSPDGTMLAYVKDSKRHVLDLLCNESKQLTSGADRSTTMHGIAEYITQEEVELRNGYWWSLDSKFIAFTRVDSSNIPLFGIMHQGKSTVGAGAHEEHAHPFAGASNVKVRLGVVYSSGGSVTWMDLLPGEKDQTNTDTWINLHDCFTPLDNGLAQSLGGFLWASKKTGFRHTMQTVFAWDQ